MHRSALKLPIIMERNPDSPISEAYRYLRNNIEFAAAEKGSKSIMVTSTLPREGKSTTAANLAIACAQAGKRVALVDAHFRKPILHEIFLMSNSSGLSSALARRQKIAEAVLETHIDNLCLIPSGPLAANLAEMLASGGLREILNELRDQYEIIIVDAPSLLSVADAQLIAAQCDGVLLVANLGKTKRKTLANAKMILEHVNTTFLGVVLNNVKKIK
ncbi:MAG TPA: CpsD/CapB family tyrosine-protein kinase [Bacilli bacterium]